MGAWVDPKSYKSGMGRESHYINLCIRAIQGELVYNGQNPGPVDGLFGNRTKTAVLSFQKEKHLYVDGIVGRKTATALFDLRADAVEALNSMPGPYIHGLMRWESAYDPGAVGPNGMDKGLVQINLSAHTEISEAQALDPTFSIPYAATRMKSAKDSFASKPEIAWDCAIAQHNSPRKAKIWFQTGSPPDDQIALYVTRIKGG